MTKGSDKPSFCRYPDCFHCPYDDCHYSRLEYQKEEEDFMKDLFKDVESRKEG